MTPITISLLGLGVYLIAGLLICLGLLMSSLWDDVDFEEPSVWTRMLCVLILPWVTLFAGISGDGYWVHLKVGIQIIFHPLLGKADL